MMSDSVTRNSSDGFRDQKGNWKPSEPAGFAPPFQRPFKPLKILKWVFGWGGYLWPMYLMYAVLAFVTVSYLQPGLETTRNLAPGWIAYLLVRNLIFTVIFYGGYHIALYVFKFQGNERKFHPLPPQEKSRKFLFGSQVWDNVFYTCVSGVPIWTAYEVLYYWAAGNGKVPIMSFADRPVWFVAIFLIIPVWRDVTFYAIHRALHWKPLLRAFHSVHHRNPNPGPWSGLSMHPVEHIVYFAQVLIHFVVPSHPMHFMFNIQITGLSPAKGHTGFEPPILKGLFPTGGDYYHYLHHKYVSCNFGTGMVPWDKWFGRYYNGEGDYKTRK